VLKRALSAVFVAAAAVALASASPAAAKLPTRIVSLSPTATESLFAIGAGKQVVAVDNQSDYPKSAPRTQLSGFTPNVEAIANYKPDLVVVSFNPKGLVESLQKLKIPVLLQQTAKSLPDAYAQIVQLGRVTGHLRQAAALVGRMKARIAALVAAAPKRSQPLSVYHEISPDYYAASSSTFVGKVYALFGLRNIADAADTSHSGYPQLSAEYILEQNPSLIVLADTRCCGQTVASVASRPGWDRLSAVRNRFIVRIDDSIASRWGPRVVDFVRAVSSALRTIGSR
jgi:iron complex transport system substrate-binding protein